MSQIYDKILVIANYYSSIDELYNAITYFTKDNKMGKSALIVRWLGRPRARNVSELFRDILVEEGRSGNLIPWMLS